MEDSQMENNRINRRDFLRIAGAGAASMVIVACAPAAPAGAPAAATEAAAAGGEAAAPAEGAVSLRVMGDPDQEAPIAGPYQEQNPNVKLEFIAVTGIDHEEVASKILSMIAAGQTIDIGYAATEALQLYAGQELSYPLDE